VRVRAPDERGVQQAGPGEVGHEPPPADYVP
jgi:hypothetical protein